MKYQERLKYTITTETRFVFFVLVGLDFCQLVFEKDSVLQLYFFFSKKCRSILYHFNQIQNSFVTLVSFLEINLSLLILVKAKMLSQLFHIRMFGA